jgi:superkiller protein 8
VGFGGDCKVWTVDATSSQWSLHLTITDKSKAGEIWAIALSEDGQFLASTTFDGRINVWDIIAGGKKIREYETKGSFGLCIDLSGNGRFTASGHQNGAVYVFNNDTGRMVYSLPGMKTPAW